MYRLKKGPYRRLLKVRKGHVEVAYGVRQYFEKDKSEGFRRNLNQVVIRNLKVFGSLLSQS